MTVKFIAFTHTDAASTPPPDAWHNVIEEAKASDYLRHGSAMGPPSLTEAAGVDPIGRHRGFEAPDRGTLPALLSEHPTRLHGNTIEQRELPQH